MAGMSNIVSALVQKRKVGSPTRKAVLMYMASCASDDGSGIWASKATIARDLEYSKRTVQAGIDDMVAAGLIQEAGKRRCAHGFTVEYRIILDAVRALDSTNQDGPKKPKSDHPELPLDAQKGTRAGAAPVQELHPTRAGAAPHGVQELHPNRTGTVNEPVCRSDTAEAFENFWDMYPRKRNREKTLKAFIDALGAGVTHEAIIAGVHRYGVENAENIRQGRRQYLAYSDNWIGDRRWEDAGEQQQCKPAGDSALHLARFWAEKIRAQEYIPDSAISQATARLIFDRGLLSNDEMNRAGGVLNALVQAQSQPRAGVEQREVRQCA